MKLITYIKYLAFPLSDSLEKEFWDRQLDLMVNPLRAAIILGSLLTWALIGSLWLRSETTRDVWILVALFQPWLAVCYWALKIRGRLRYFTIYMTPLIPAVLAHLFATYLVPNLPSRDAMLQAQYFPFIMIICFYAFETLSLTFAMISGLSVSIVVIVARAKNLAVIGGQLNPLILMAITTNIVGIVMCLFVRHSSRMQFKYIKAAEREREVSDSLIQRVFPEIIGRELRTKGSNLARSYQNVTILLADLANFTRITTTMEPRQLVTILHELFHRFDRLADIHGVEKIKTIGDAYMAAAGCPNPSSDHAQRVAYFALELQRSLRSFNKNFQTEFRMRIGINSGPVVGGVISGKRISFDIWGETVNLASRLQTTAEPDEIIISDTTAKILRPEFTVSDFRMADLKGLGPTPLARLVSTKDKNPFLRGKSKVNSSVGASELAFLSQH